MQFSSSTLGGRGVVFAAGLLLATVSALLGGRALVAHEVDDPKYAVNVPDGLGFAEFKGYEGWQVVSVSYTGELIKAILGNPITIEAYRSGAPFDGKTFPEGAKMAKIMWKPAKSQESPFPVVAADTLQRVDFMVKDSKRFSTTAGWGYAQFNYAPATGAFTPDGRGANCGAACHKAVAAKDSVFTSYGRR